MTNPDLVRLSRKALLEHFEQERLEWLAAGMNEAAIFRIHFGDIDVNCKLIIPKDGSFGGDYLSWLAERKHIRPDHKYAPGTPIAIDTVDPEGTWINTDCSGLDDIEFNIDLEAVLSTLTELQRVSFIEVRLHGQTQADVARILNVSRESVKQAIRGALKKLKKYFS